MDIPRAEPGPVRTDAPSHAAAPAAPVAPHGHHDQHALSPELEECLAILVRAVFVNSIDPTLPQHERWAIYANFPGLPWRPHPNDLPVELPDVH